MEGRLYIGEKKEKYYIEYISYIYIYIYIYISYIALNMQGSGTEIAKTRCSWKKPTWKILAIETKTRNKIKLFT